MGVNITNIISQILLCLTAPVASQWFSMGQCKCFHVIAAKLSTDEKAAAQSFLTQLYCHISKTVAVSILGCPFLPVPAMVYK